MTIRIQSDIGRTRASPQSRGLSSVNILRIMYDGSVVSGDNICYLDCRSLMKSGVTNLGPVAQPDGSAVNLALSLQDPDLAGTWTDKGVYVSQSAATIALLKFGANIPIADGVPTIVTPSLFTIMRITWTLATAASLNIGAW